VRSVPTSDLQATAANILRALGTPDDVALDVADSLVSAQVVGHDSHGLIRLVEYAQFVDSGKVRPAARPTVVTSRGSTAVIDGQWGWGQVACRLGVTTARALAYEYGVSMVTVRHCNHVGRIGEYVEALALEGLVGVVCCNAEPAVAPYGGKARMLGTNPLAVGIPLSEPLSPVVLDFATAATAEGKLRVARATGGSIPSGSVIDAHGSPATTAEAFYAGGALLPFGGHKGYGLSVVIEMLGGALSGNHPSTSPDYSSGNGVVFIAIDPDFVVGRTNFTVDTTSCAQALRSSPAVDPDHPVLVPGDVENHQRSLRAGKVPIPDEIWAQLSDLAAKLHTTTVPAD
jgi:uncharacterized oxidoreductase